jgi:hypothetical protein
VRDKVTGGWRNQIKEHEMGLCTHGRSAYKILIRKPEGKRPLGALRHRWEDNIKIGHKVIGCEGVD